MKYSCGKRGEVERRGVNCPHRADKGESGREGRAGAVGTWSEGGRWGQRVGFGGFRRNVKRVSEYMRGKGDKSEYVV